MNAGKSLRIALVGRSMSQKQLAEQMGFSREYVCRMAGQEKIGIGTIVKLAKFFGMKVSEFLALGE